MTHLVAMHHEVVRGDQGFEDHHPAGVAGPLHQRVGHLGDVHVGFLGRLDQDCEEERRDRRSGGGYQQGRDSAQVQRVPKNLLFK